MEATARGAGLRVSFACVRREGGLGAFRRWTASHDTVGYYTETLESWATLQLALARSLCEKHYLVGAEPNATNTSTKTWCRHDNQISRSDRCRHSWIKPSEMLANDIRCDW